MLITNHVLSGAVTGAVLRRPAPAFLAGVLSHFALDGLPHWGRWQGQADFLRVAVADGLTGLAAMAVLTAAAPRDRRAAVVAGMVGAALPDIDKPTSLWFGFSPWPAAVDRFHNWIQDEAPDRFGREAAAGCVLAAAAAVLLRRRGGRPGRSVAGQAAERGLDALLRDGSAGAQRLGEQAHP